MNEKFFTDTKIIKKAITDKNLVIFTGAGISIDAGVPSWSQLVEKLQKEISVPNGEYDSLRIAQMHYNDRGPKEHIDRIRHVLKHKKVRFNEIHEAIFDLSPEQILTTNYDDLLEQVIKSKAYPFSVIQQDSDFPYAKGRNLLVKVHGDLDLTNIVLKEDDYIKYSEEHPLIEAFLKSLFASKVVLFIGYSFSDIDLKMIIQRVRTILGANFQNSYLLNTDDNFHPTQREYLKNKGINVINYNEAIQNDKNYIEEYLNGKNALKEKHFLKGRNLSTKGQKLLNFIRFLNYYDAFIEPLSKLNVIQQAHFSLKRFSEFNALPSDFLANLYPFNITRKYVHRYSENKLLTHNEDITNLFYDCIEYTDEGKMKFEKGEIKCNLHKIGVKDRESDYKQLLKEIILKLNQSGIYYINKKGDSPDSFGNYGWDRESKLILLNDGSEEYKKTLLFKYDNFQFLELINLLDSSSITDTSDLKLDFEIAYFNHKLGNFYSSFKQFEEIANKAWQTGNYIVYFLAKKNIKHLRNFFRYERTLSGGHIEEIQNTIDGIDMNQILVNLPNIDKEQYKLLSKIENGTIFNNFKDEIYKDYSEIVENFERYKGGGELQGYSAAFDLRNKIVQLVNFYLSNCIIFDEFSNFKSVISKAIDGFLISFATDDKYQGKYKRFDKFTIEIWLQYGDKKSILKTIEQYKITQIDLNDDAIKHLIQIANNFLSANHEKNKFLGGTYVSSNFIRQTQKSFFEDKIRYTFNNLFILLSLVKIEKTEKTTTLIDNLINFLTHSNELFGNNIDYLNDFTHFNGHLFSKEHLDKLIVIGTQKTYFQHHRVDFFYIVSDLVIKNNLDVKLQNKFLVDKILNEGKSSRNIYIQLIHIWKISDDEVKNHISNEIVEHLRNKFSFDIYANAIINQVIPVDSFFDECIRYIERISKSNEEDGFNFEYREFTKLLFLIEFDLEDKRLKQFKKYDNFKKFGLSPNKFNYSKLNLKWLLYYGFELFMIKVKDNQEIKNKITSYLKDSYDEELSKLYFKWFC